MMLTIFASPRAFRGEFDVIQRNAIQSWLQLKPTPQVLLMGIEEGVELVSHEFGIQHVPNVRVNEFGTPLANSMIEEAERLSQNRLLLWLAADTMLLDDVISAAEEISQQFQRFCMIVGRYHWRNPEAVHFDDPNWALRLRSSAVGPFLREMPAGDFFLFPRGFWGEFPPFAEGKRALDNWLFYRVLELGAPLVDATEVIMTVHQDHGYNHPHGLDGIRQSIEVQNNLRLAGRYLLTRENANWLLSGTGLKKPARSVRRHLADCHRLSVFHPWARWPLRAYRYGMRRLFSAFDLMPSDAL